MTHGYIIGRVENSGYDVTDIPRVQVSFAKAQAEAERLARKHPGVAFVIFQPINSFRIPPRDEVERKVIHMEAQEGPETDATDSIPY